MTRVLKSGCWSMFTSPEIDAFEADFSEVVGGRFAILVNSCTTAILAALSALNIGPGSRVAAPAFTYIGSCLPASVLGAQIEWVDIGSDTQNLDPQALSRVLATGGIEAVICPQLFGACDEYESLIDVCTKHEVPMIFDCAQFLGSRDVTKRMLEAGMCCFSFGESKILRIGEGGAVVTNSEALAEQIRLMRHEGEIWAAHRRSRVSISQTSPRDVLSGLVSITRGLNLRPAALLATLGRVQLTGLERFLATTRQNAFILNSALSGVAPLQLPHTRPVWWTFPVVITDEEIGRDTLLAALLAEGVPVGVHFPVLLPDHPVFRQESALIRQRFPHAAAFADRHLVLPIYPRLHEGHLRRLGEVCVAVLENHMLRAESTRRAAREFLRRARLRELSAGLYLFVR